MSPLIVIPARMASTRLPGKPLADIGGIPMIVRVWQRAMEAACGPVAVAAGEAEIVAAVTAAGGRAVLTAPGLPSGSDRVHAALTVLDPSGAHDVVVNLQGDLPHLDPAAIRTALDALTATGADIATLAARITDESEAANPAMVKAVVAWDADERLGRALYFSRAAVPANEGPRYHHVGIYAWRRAALARFVSLPPSPLERRESLEQLRAQESGMTIGVARVDSVPLSVDTPADLEHAREFLKR